MGLKITEEDLKCHHLIFWDVPRLKQMSSKEFFNYIKELRKNGNREKLLHILRRFIQYGNATEGILLFKGEEIKEALEQIKRSPRSLQFFDPVRLRAWQKATEYADRNCKEGVKIDLVVDHLSSKGSRPKVKLKEDSFLSLDLVDNIIVNKICSVVSRGEPKDVIDLFFLIKDNKGQFWEFFKRASDREALLEDLLYVSSAFENITEAAEQLILDIKDTLRRPVDPLEFRNFWFSLQEEIESRI